MYRMRAFFLLLLCVLCAAQYESAFGGRKKPHIVFILADDYGYRDIGYHGAEFPTANMDRLAGAGIKLEGYYAQCLCSPTRSALMTGRYPCRTCLQHSVLLNPQAAGLPLDEVTLAQKMTEAGYATHAIGKWHLGFYKWEYTPTYRGFQSHVGFWVGQEDHYLQNSTYVFTGHDFRNNSQVSHVEGQYSGDIFRDTAVQKINNHARESPKKPLFLYLALQTPHVPLQAPLQYFAKCVNITNPARQAYCAMVQHMDYTVGAVEEALRKNNMLEDTLIVFSADNGGWIPGAASNLPLRGQKYQNFEGGVRAIGFVNGYGIPKHRKGKTYKGLMHMVDWFPTLLHVADGNTHGTKPLDGVNQWEAILGGFPVRYELLHNADDIDQSYAIRSGPWKLILGAQPMEMNCTANCTYLFNIDKDPYETNNQYDSEPVVVAYLKARLETYKKGSVTPCFPPADPQSNPALHNGEWVPWQSPASA